MTPKPNGTCGCGDKKPSRTLNSSCKSCNKKEYVAGNFTDPQYDTCKPASKTNLPPGICDSKEWECFDKTPYCSIENGYLLGMLKASTFLDLDILQGFDPRNFAETPDNWDMLKCIDYKPVKGIISGANTIAHMHEDGTYQIDLVTTFPFSQLKSVDYPKFSGTSLDVIGNVQSEEQIWVYMGGLLLMAGADYTVSEGLVYYKIDFPNNLICQNIQVKFQEAQPEVVSDDTDILVKVSENDTVASYLEQKIIGGFGVNINVINEGDNESIEISLENALPDASTLDCGKVLGVNKDGEWALSNCCGNNAIKVSGTDDVDLELDACLSFESEDLDIIMTEDVDNDCIVANVAIRDGLELFTIVDGNAVPASTSVNNNGILAIKSEDSSILVDISQDCINLELRQINSDILVGTYIGTESPNGVPLNGQGSVTYTSSDDTVNVAVSSSGTSQTHDITLEPAYYGGKTGNGGIQTFASNVLEDVNYSSIVNTNNSAVGAPSNGVQALKEGLHYIEGQVYASFSSHDEHTYVLNIKKNGVVIKTIEEEGTFRNKTIQFHTSEQMNANDIITVDFIMSANGNLDLVSNRHYLHISPLR